MNGELQHKTAIVTGAAQGIGRGIAVQMARAGAEVVIVDLPENHQASQTTLAMVTKHQRGAVFDLDITSLDQHQRLVADVVTRMGKVDILVNNAGIGAEKGFLDTSRDQARKVMNTNFFGPFFLSQQVAKYMSGAGIHGVILYTSSTHSQVTMLRPMYSASKAAIEMFIKEAALELLDHQIRVNAVAPGVISVDGALDRSSEHVPVGYAGTPEDIGNVMVFLASDKASYITGQTLIVDGGFSLAHTHYWIDKGVL